MSDSLEKPWSGNPNAPQISYPLYFADKVNFAGDSIAAISYGIVTVLFFQCMGALFDPANYHGRGVRWGLVLHTVTMFMLITISVAMGLNLQSISHVDNREFPADGQFYPGPLGYKAFIYTRPISLVPNLIFQLNQWLADGLLLYRCYIIYAMNYRVIAFPCLMYLTSFVTGIGCMYLSSLPENVLKDTAISNDFNYPYFTVSLSLNILLTSMIVIRLVLHRRNIRNAMGSSVGAGQLYGAVITILVESSALYAVSFLLFFVPWAAGIWVGSNFWPILLMSQVIAPFLIIRRVAGRRALTSEAIVSRDPGSIRFRSQGDSTDSNGTLADGNPTRSPTDAYGKTVRDLGAGVGITPANSHHNTSLEG